MYQFSKFPKEKPEDLLRINFEWDQIDLLENEVPYWIYKIFEEITETIHDWDKEIYLQMLYRGFVYILKRVGVNNDDSESS